MIIPYLFCCKIPKSQYGRQIQLYRAVSPLSSQYIYRPKNTLAPPYHNNFGSHIPYRDPTPIFEHPQPPQPIFEHPQPPHEKILLPTLSLCFGIISILVSLSVGVLAFIPNIAGLVLALISSKKVSGSGLARAGLIINIISLIINLLLTVIVVLVLTVVLHY